MIHPRVEIRVVEIHIREAPQVGVVARLAQRLAMPLLQRLKADEGVFERDRFDGHARGLSRGRWRG